jgi:hypothetical protein
MKGERFQGAFGGIEQAEVQRLHELGAPADAIYVLVMLRVRTRPGGLVVDTIPTLGKWTGRPKTAVKEALRWLREHGVVVMGPRASIESGQRGQWRRVISLRPLPEWGTSASAEPKFSVGNSPTTATPEPKLKQLQPEHETTSARTRDNFSQDAGDNPNVNPEVYPKEGAAAPVSVNEEGFVKDVVGLWRAARNKPGLERFTDAAPIKNLKVAAKRARAQGCTLADMARAIAIHGTDANANPWYVDEWAREARAEREEREQFERRLRDRAREEAEWQARP